MKKILLSSILFCALAQFGFAQLELPDCQELFISEYVEGSNKNRVLEIYNPSQGVIDLSNYSIKIFTAGPNNPNVLPMSGFLPPKEVHVCGHPQADPTGILPKCNATSNEIKFDGNDAVGLYKNDTLIDVIGVIGVNPGNTGWMVGTGFTKNNTLVRGFDGGPTPYWSQSQFEWIVFPNDDTLQLGKHESVCATAIAYFLGNNQTGNEITVFEDVGTVILPVKVGSGLNQIIDGDIYHNPNLQCVDPIESIHITDYITQNDPSTTIKYQIPANAANGTNPVSAVFVDIVDDNVFESEDEIICFKLLAGQNLIIDDDINQLIYPEYRIIVKDNDPATSIEEQMQKNIKVYPTIATEKLFIEMRKYKRDVHIDMYNSFGQLVKSMTWNGQAGTIELGVNELSRGMYVISVQGEEWKVTKKFIRN